MQIRFASLVALFASMPLATALAVDGGPVLPAPGSLQNGGPCAGLPTQAALKAALEAATITETSGLDLQMWGSIVNRDGVVCAVAFTGTNRGSQWPGSRVISAQKANTANAFSLDGLSLSTANLYGPVQGTSAASPFGGSLYGLQLSNPVDTSVAYGGNPVNYGQPNDPMTGRRIGGVNVFGGGLALYDANRKVIGAVGVSGDTSCADHNIAWRTRDNLGFDNLVGVGGVAALNGDAGHPDNMMIDGTNTDTEFGAAAGVTDGFEQPACINTTNPTLLPVVQ
jgi:uncharacterized protein GlcG (DUF336 family)